MKMLNRIIFELNKKTHNNYSSLFMRTFLSKTQRFIFTKQSGFEFTAKFPSKIYTQKLNFSFMVEKSNASKPDYAKVMGTPLA